MAKQLTDTFGVSMAAVALALTTVVADRMVLAQTTPTRISVEDHRPLAAMVRQMEKDHGWIITYEDPPYEHPSQILDVTATARRDSSTGGRVLVPRRGAFTFQYQLPPDAARDGRELIILQDMVSRYSQSGNDGDFRVFGDGGIYHVVPTAMRRKDGVTQSHVSLLDSVVTMPGSTGTVLERLMQIVGELENGNGTRLELGIVPMVSAFDRRKIRSPAVQKPARTALVDLFQSSGLRVSWQLLCQPGVGKSCYLSLHEVAKR